MITGDSFERVILYNINLEPMPSNALSSTMFRLSRLKVATATFYIVPLLE